METKQTENTIDLRRLWLLIKSHILGILIWTVGLGIVGYALASFLIQPK